MGGLSVLLLLSLALHTVEASGKLKCVMIIMIQDHHDNTITSYDNADWPFW